MTSSRSLAVEKCPLKKIHNYPSIRHPRDMSKPWRSVCTNKSFNRVDPFGLIPFVRVSAWGGEIHPNNGAASWWYSRLHFLEAKPIVRTAALHIRIFVLVLILHFFQILLSWLKASGQGFQIPAETFCHKIHGPKNLRLKWSLRDKWSHWLAVPVSPPQKFQRHPPQCTVAAMCSLRCVLTLILRPAWFKQQNTYTVDSWMLIKTK